MKTAKFLVLQNFRLIIYITVIFLLPITSAFGTTTISNVSVSNPSPAAGSEITVYFDITVNATEDVQFAIGFTQYASMPQCGMDWVASGAGVYTSLSSASWWYDPTTRTATKRTETYVPGPNGTGGGMEVPSRTNGTTTRVAVSVKVPPEYNGTFYTAIVTYQHSADLRWNCNSGTSSLNDDTDVSTTINVSGGSYPKLDLEMCEGASDAVKIEFFYRIKNYSESGVLVNDLKWRHYIYDTLSDYNANCDSSGGCGTGGSVTNCIQKVYMPDGTTTFGPDNCNVNNFTAMTSTDCGSNRKANMFYERYFNITSGSGAYILIPPAGGFITNGGSGVSILRHYPTATNIDQSDDYSNITALTCYNSSCITCANEDTKYNTVYYKGQLACEWDSAAAIDDATGEEPCAATGCYMQAAKSANVSYAYIGDTITFCITVTSTADSDLEVIVWDTVPANTMYVGCDNSCTYDGTMVNWVVPLAPGYSATRCFWVKVTGYPYLFGEGGFFAALDPMETKTKNDHSVFALDGWGFLMTSLQRSAIKN